MPDPREQREADARADESLRETEALRRAVEELTARMASLEQAVEKVEGVVGSASEGGGDSEPLAPLLQQLIDGQGDLIELARNAENRALAGSVGTGG